MKLEWVIIILLLMAIAISARAGGIGLTGDVQLQSSDCGITYAATNAIITAPSELPTGCTIALAAGDKKVFVVTPDGRRLRLFEKGSVVVVLSYGDGVVYVTGDYE